MLTSMAPRLFRFLLSLVIHLRRSVGRIALAFRARFASFWRSLLTFTCRGGQSPEIRLHANDSPVVDNTPQILGPGRVEEESSGTLAALPVQRPARWEDILSEHQALTPSDQFKFDPYPATPEGGSQRYKPRTVM